MKIILFLFAIIILRSHAECSVLYFNTDSYHGRADNPFLSKLDGGLVYVEDFEEQGSQRPRNLMTTPNATGWNGIASGSMFWGVQEDYTQFEPLGYRWTNAGNSSDATNLPAGIHFDFTPDAQGRLPEYVGAALRGSTILGTDPNFNVILVYNSAGQEVTQGSWLIPKPIPDPSKPIEDLFLNFEGIYVSGGISRIHFRDFREVDHLTYGYSIPEPSAALLATAAGLLSLRRKRKLIP